MKKTNNYVLERINNDMPQMCKHANGMYTLNALIHTLKHYCHMEHCCLASEDGYCISDISRTYVPTRQLARFVRTTEVDVENNAVFFEWIEHPLKGVYGL